MLPCAATKTIHPIVRSTSLHGRSATSRAVVSYPLPHPSFPVAGVETELAPPTQPSFEIVDELPTRGHNNIDLGAPPREHGANEGEYVDAGEEVGGKGSEMTSKRVTSYAYYLYSLLALN